MSLPALRIGSSMERSVEVSDAEPIRTQPSLLSPHLDDARGAVHARCQELLACAMDRHVERVRIHRQHALELRALAPSAFGRRQALVFETSTRERQQHVAMLARIERAFDTAMRQRDLDALFVSRDGEVQVDRLERHVELEQRRMIADERELDAPRTTAR